jgi:drug/metabolite transporter (DMT)-like permease
VDVARLVALTSLAMVAFAGNSLLCRAALRQTDLDAATFTTARLASGAAFLWLIARRRGTTGTGNWRSALALFAYAAGFSFAYLSLPAATGALLLFGAVQATMIGHGLWAGERLQRMQLGGLALALGGLVGLLLPGLSAPPLGGSLLMLGAGVAWGVYSLRGRGSGDPLKVTAGNFLRAVPLAAALSLAMHGGTSLDGAGLTCAVLSGALASGVGYALWYAALPALKATTAATVQLSVPVIAAMGGIVLLGEPMTLRVVLASVAILGGIALVVRYHGKRAAIAYPDDADGDALRRIASDGNDMRRPMPIDYHVAASTSAAAEAIREAARGIGYSTKVVEEVGGFTVWCTREMLATHDGVLACQAELHRIARPLGGHIDGWGTSGNADPPPPR